ncbi:MAG: sulfate adenylyltransferase subunit CysN [Bacteroidales bacterium]|jgi:bifunctional enzyme CysN/CysC|nr:sulfate adenylyltransferase subunit CysN [Bacteroidales bacterium]
MHSTSLNIQQYLDQDQKKDLLRLLTAGSVDDGKSTLIGRLLFDSKKLYDDHLAALERDSKRIGHAGEDIDYALLMDGLKAEREQGITIDVAYRYFSTNKRKFIIADTPGHEQYTRNMVTGASTANLAIILVDARKGIITQTKRHTFLVSLLGIKHIVLAVNKMDLMDFSQEVFDQICNDYKSFITRLDIPEITFIPLSALKGDNVVDLSDKMPWYHGKSLLEHLENIHIASDRNLEDFRYPVQFVLRPSIDFRGFSGKVSSGIIRKGDEVMALPSGKTSKVKSIITYDGELEYAHAPQSVTLTLEDEIDISRGEMLVLPNNRPKVEQHFEAMLVWMDEKAMNSNTQFYIKHNSNNTKARIDKINYFIDVNSLEQYHKSHFELNEIGRVVITTVKPLFFDAYKKNRQTGSFILIDPMTHNTVAVGMIIDKVRSKDLPFRISDIDRQKIVRGQNLVNQSEYEGRYGQKGVTLWITGLHGSGKNQLAYTLEKKLFDRGAVVVLLDGKTVRAGLSKELDYSLSDRVEHLRRVAHLSKMLNDKGIITICSFVSPDENIRYQVAEIINGTLNFELKTSNLKNRFHLIHMDASLDFCKQNDAYGLYDLAAKGEILNIPGIDIPFENPKNAQLILDGTKAEEAVAELMKYLEDNALIS